MPGMRSERRRAASGNLVFQADVSNATENVQRRALLYRRRGHMWQELPADTEWWEVQIEPSDLKYIRVFPRAQWRRIANGSFLLPDIVGRINTRSFAGIARECVTRVHAISAVCAGMILSVVSC